MGKPGQTRYHRQAQQRNHTGQGLRKGVVDNAKVLPHGGQAGKGDEYRKKGTAAIQNKDQHRQEQKTCNPSF